MKSLHRFTGVAVAALLALPAPWCQAQDANLGRDVAATCANCHGTNGQSRGEVSALAGMSAERIGNALAGYKSGALTGTIMQQIAKGYTDEQITAVAAYLAAQKPRQ